MKTLELLLVRKEDVLCTRCLKIEPINAGHGTPAPAFIMALYVMAERHEKCRSPREAAREGGK